MEPEVVPNLGLHASPLLDEVEGAVEFGMNAFRVPFRIEYVHELWNGTWLQRGDVPEYIPPNPNYLQMVVDFIEATLALPPAKLAGPGTTPPRVVIFDLHNYFRWCPMGIGGTFSCLEPTGYDGPIRYSVLCKDVDITHCAVRT